MPSRVLLAAFLLALIACSPAAPADGWVRHRQWSTQTEIITLATTWPDVVRPGLELGVGFVRPEHAHIHPYERPSTELFELGEGEPLSVLLILSTGHQSPYPVLVSAFLDYTQVVFSLDGKQGLLHYLEIEPGADMHIPIQVPVDEPGWHDFFVTVFPSPEYHPTDPDERLPPSFGAGGRRAVICSGDRAVDGERLPTPLVGEPSAEERFDHEVMPLLPADGRPPNERLLVVTSIPAGQPLDLELWAKNRTTADRQYVIISLVDYHQVPFAGQKWLYLEMPAASELFLPGQLPIPRPDGIYEVQFITVSDPYERIAHTSNPFVTSPMRSAVVVGESQLAAGAGTGSR